MSVENFDLIPLVYKIPTPGYFVKKDGSIWSNKKLGIKKLKTYEHKTGYLKCCLTINNKQHRVSVHRLIATTFYGVRPDRMVCRHLDGNKRNNSASNLTWGTQKENIDDCKLHGTTYEGEKHYLSKIPDKTVTKIRAMYANGYTQKYISEMLGLPKNSVHNYVKGKSRRSAGCL